LTSNETDHNNYRKAINVLAFFFGRTANQVTKNCS
jgi:hypothetical protein